MNGHSALAGKLPDFYQLLGVDRRTDVEGIKEAFHRKALKLHPDVNNNPVDHELFRAVNEAYQVLSDSTQRKKYDAMRLLSAAMPLSAVARVFQDPVRVREIMEKMGVFLAVASGLIRKPESRAGRDLRVEAEISLEDSRTGTKRGFRYGREVDCGACRGIGFARVSACAGCGGSGRIAADWLPRIGKRCPRCGARGWIGEESCRPCRGTGRVLQNHKIEVNIPPGVEDGGRLRVAGHGEAGRSGGKDGDLIVCVKVLRHPHSRHGKERRGA